MKIAPALLARTKICIQYIRTALLSALLALGYLISGDEPKAPESVASLPDTSAPRLENPAALPPDEAPPTVIVGGIRPASIAPAADSSAVLDSRLADSATDIEFMVHQPAAAIAKAEEIQCLALRFNTLNEILVTWARHQPAAAREQLSRLDSLPQIEFAQLQAVLSESPAL